MRGLIAAVLCLCLLLNLYLLAEQFLFHRDPPEVFGYSPLIVGSGSMEPTLMTGDVVVIHEQAEYELGEVVTFRDASGTLITHRIVGITGSQFITKGDANNTEDQELLSEEQIVGAAVTRLPGAGMVLNFFRTPVGIVLLFLVGILIIELPAWIGNLKEKKTRHRGGKHAHGGE